MAKRFSDTRIWEEDWFLEMPIEYRLFWFYMLASCDHAGFFKVNARSFCALNGVKINTDEAYTYFNNGKVRLRKVNGSMWLIEDFFSYQYGNVLNRGNRVHKSIENQYIKHNVDLRSIRGLIEVKDGVKDKEKDKE